MKKLIEEFWFGNLRPFEQLKSADQRVIEKATNIRDTLVSTLSDEQKGFFETYEIAFDTLNMEKSKTLSCFFAI